MSMGDLGWRLFTFGRSLLPANKERIALAARHAMAADAADKAFDFPKALEEYRQAYELVAGIDNRFASLYRYGEAGVLFSMDKLGDQDALKRAVELLEQVVDDSLAQKNWELWTTASRRLGLALQRLGVAARDRKQLLYAVIVLEQVREAMKRDSDPSAWAEVHYSLGDARLMLGMLTVQPAELRKAVTALETALTVWTCETAKLQWANTHFSLGASFGTLGDMGGGTEDLAKAVDAFAASASAWDPEKEREASLWAVSQANLATALLVLGTHSGDRGAVARGREAAEMARQAYRKIGDADEVAMLDAKLKEFDVALAQ